MTKRRAQAQVDETHSAHVSGTGTNPKPPRAAARVAPSSCPVVRASFSLRAGPHRTGRDARTGHRAARHAHGPRSTPTPLRARTSLSRLTHQGRQSTRPRVARTPSIRPGRLGLRPSSNAGTRLPKPAGAAASPALHHALLSRFILISACETAARNGVPSLLCPKFCLPTPEGSQRPVCGGERLICLGTSCGREGERFVA